MKVTGFVIFFLASFSTIFALPAGREESEEVEFIPLEDQNRGRVPVVVDTGVLSVPWYSSPFDGLFESLSDMMARMRQQMDFLLRRLPSTNKTSFDDAVFPGFPDLDLSKANTTSVTKVIDGHKVVINETEYNQDGANGGAHFKVRIIDVQPDSSELTTEKNAESITPKIKDVEPLESSQENEIPKNREIETFIGTESLDPVRKTAGDMSNRPTKKFENMAEYPSSYILSQQPLNVDANVNQQFPKFVDGDSEWANLEYFESFEDNSLEPYRPPPDLSRDTYVNQLMADSGAPVNPDAEIFSDVKYNVPYSLSRSQSLQQATNPR